jgi:type I restriction enzyme S subunit
VITLQRGFDITQDQQTEGEYPVISSSGIKSYHAEYKMEGPGVIIGRKGTLGTVFFIKGKYWPHDTTLWVKDFHNNYPQFIYYFLKQFDLQNYDVGSSNPTLNRNHVHLLPCSIPSYPEQKTIASILSSLDDKIDLLHRQNKSLEAMAEALFRQWFVEEADEGWEIVTIENLIKIGSGKSLEREKFVENGLYPILGANGEIGKTDNYLFNERLLFTGRVGTLGNIFRVENKKVWLSDNTLYIKPKCYFNFIYFILKYAKLEGYNVGSTQPLIRQSDIKEIEVLMPNTDKVVRFEIFSDSLFFKVAYNITEIRTLEKMRDSLLPKLMDGEARLEI